MESFLHRPFEIGDEEMFCHNCGANAGDAKFCPECGTRILAQNATTENGSGTLTMRKYHAPRMRELSADIYIDGAFRAVIGGNAESQSFTLPAGIHEVLIHADGCVDALQHISVEPLENRLCIFSVDDMGIINIVQDGTPSRSAGRTGGYSSAGVSRSGAAAAYAGESVPMPETGTRSDSMTESWTQGQQALQKESIVYTAPENSKYCKFCGSLIHEESVVCPNCGRQVEKLRGEEPQVIYRQASSGNTYVDNRSTVIHSGKAKDKWIAFFLCLFLGYLGIHKFYEGKIGMGILYLCTFGLFGIGAIIDLIAIVMKPNPYYVN